MPHISSMQPAGTAAANSYIRGTTHTSAGNRFSTRSADTRASLSVGMLTIISWMPYCATTSDISDTSPSNGRDDSGPGGRLPMKPTGRRPSSECSWSISPISTPSSPVPIMSAGSVSHPRLLRARSTAYKTKRIITSKAMDSTPSQASPCADSTHGRRSRIGRAAAAARRGNSSDIRRQIRSRCRPLMFRSISTVTAYPAASPPGTASSAAIASASPSHTGSTVLRHETVHCLSDGRVWGCPVTGVLPGGAVFAVLACRCPFPVCGRRETSLMIIGLR